MVRRLCVLLNYIILYTVCILISVNWGQKEHKVITEKEDKVNAILKSSGYELNKEYKKPGYTELTYTSGNDLIHYEFRHDYESAKLMNLDVHIYMNYNDDVELIVNTINNLTFKEMSISYDDVMAAIEEYKITGERQEISNSEVLDTYGRFYILSIYESTNDDAKFCLSYRII